MGEQLGLTQVIDSDVHLKAIDCFCVGAHHHAGVVDEDVKLVDICRREHHSSCDSNTTKSRALQVDSDPLVLTSQELLCEGSYGAGVCQVELSDLHLCFRTRSSYTGCSLFSFLHISARHDHPSACRVKNKQQLNYEL